MRLRVRHVVSAGGSPESEIVQAKNPKVAAQLFAYRNYMARGERIDVLMGTGDDRLSYEVSQSRIDEGGCRVRYVGKNE